MYNLPLPNLRATLLVASAQLSLTADASELTASESLSVLYCTVPYIAACVDVSRTVFLDRSYSLPDLKAHAPLAFGTNGQIMRSS